MIQLDYRRVTAKISNSLARYPIYGLTLYGLTIGEPECYFDSYQSLALSIRHLEVGVKNIYILPGPWAAF